MHVEINLDGMSAGTIQREEGWDEIRSVEDFSGIDCSQQRCLPRDGTKKGERDDAPVVLTSL